MKNVFLIAAALFGIISVTAGALGAHWLKDQLSLDKWESFNTAVRYQMYHALSLLFIAFNLNTRWEKAAGCAMLIGVVLFSGSIYLLSTADIWKLNLKCLGPITPLGGLFMLAGWGILLIGFITHRIT